MNIGITVYTSYGGSGIVGSELGREFAKKEQEHLRKDSKLIVYLYNFR
jgi:hypothetical protein